MMKITRFAAFWGFALSLASIAATVKEISAALDITGQKGIQLVSSSKIVFKVAKYYDEYYDYVLIDEDGDDEIENRKTDSVKANAGWTVQSGSKWSVSPVKGKTCLRSDLPTERSKSSDAQLARLVFKVYGPGTLTFLYRTSTDFGDAINVYVDGVISPDTPNADGYGPDDEMGWGYAADDVNREDYRNQAVIKIDEGPAPEGSAYAGTYFHEIRVEFEKDLPKYDYDDNDKLVYVKDGPDSDDIDYDELIDNFHNTVWLDDFEWQPDAVVMGFEEETEFIDFAKVFIASNVSGFDYTIRYTTNGTAPKSTSTLYDSEEGIVITKSATVKASVFFTDVADMDGDGNTSEIVKYTSADLDTESIDIHITASAPVISVDTNASTNTTAAIVFSKGYDANVIRYTLDGSDPTAASAVYNGPIMLSETKTIKAICTRDGVSPSEVVTYELRRAERPVVRTVAGNGDSWVTTANTLKAVATANDGATIMYGPAGNLSNVYTGEVSMNAASRQSLCFQSVFPGGIPSEIVTVTAYKADKSFTMPELHRGWNLVSVPMSATPESIEAALASNQFFGYDSANRSYARAFTLVEGGSYWVFSRDGGAGATLQGTVIGGAQPVSGWNFMGAKIGSTAIPSGAKVLQFDGSSFQRMTSGPLVPGIGYWIYK